MVFSEILSGLVAWVLSFVHAYGAFSVFIVVILEELLLPVPSPLVIMGASFILIPSDIAFWDAVSRIFFNIVIPASIASTIGSFFAYGIGYFGGRRLVMKFHKFLRISWETVEIQEKKMEKGNKVWVTIAVLRAIPFFPIAIVSLSAGVLRLSWKKYAVATFIGSIPRTFILGLVGWELGSAYVSIAGKLNMLEQIVTVIVVVAIIYMLYRYRHKYADHYRRIFSRQNKKQS
ncbi:MAG TPA: VTT domain-containing protein [archaeon]|nr:VTT domain-containing protein [archaeon]